MKSLNRNRMPPITAIIGQACYSCFKEGSTDVALQKCTQCKSVRYCGAACQTKDWKAHKGICKALNKLEGDFVLQQALFFALSDAPATRLYDLDTIVMTMSQNQVRFVQQNLKRRLTIAERNLIALEPHCLGCGRSDRIMRMEALKKGFSTATTLTPCPSCALAFFCCTEHWTAVEPKHSVMPFDFPDDAGPAAPEHAQCAINCEIQVDVRFAGVMSGAGMGEFRWAPERVVPAWASLEGKTMYDEFGEGVGRAQGIPEAVLVPWMRAASEGLSMPMTILWALERLNEGDEGWTRKEVLTVHMLGAHQQEAMKADVFEEILHRLPEVKKLNLVLCNPELADLMAAPGGEMDMDTCGTCRVRGRKRVHRHFFQTYHDYAKTLGTKYVKPDLAIAFNAGFSEESQDEWKQTIDFLIKNKIPTAFTAYNKDEAAAEAAILKRAGAKLVPGLGPLKNVWGSMLMKKEPNRVTGFYSINRWLTGGFR